ncbi:MAG: efflux RND transporter periplasmic adaptor subunit [Pseudomonadota bacterium]
MKDSKYTLPRRWPGIAGAFLMLLLAVLLTFEAEDPVRVSASSGEAAAPPVSVISVAAGDTRARVSAFAELRPRWNAAIRSAVSGRITAVFDAALAGQRIEAGETLFTIERTAFETAVAAAELQLEEARLVLWQAENAVTLAKGEFARSGTEAPNDLALRLPQLRIAQRSVASAEAQLRAAERQLEDTTVIAPFAGIVTQRLVSLGQTVSAGEALLQLSDDREYELTVELEQRDWDLLAHPIAGTEVALFHRDGTAMGAARVRQGGGFLDPQTRQRRVFLSVTNGDGSLLAGDFVRASFNGRLIPRTLELPESALTRTGHVWFVDADNHLQRLEPDILLRTDERLVIRALKEQDEALVALTPLASFLPGQRVNPLTRG